MIFRKMIIATVAVAMMGSQALAAEVSTLAPGKPAGIQDAQRSSPNLLIALGAAVVIAGAVAIAVSMDDSKGGCGSSCNAPTPSTTP
jgi:predicted DNA repair protein MutK